MIQAIRKNLCWLFAISSFITLYITIESTVSAIHRHYRFFLLRTLLVPTLYTTASVIFGLAWWTVLKERRSARCWAIAASIIYVLTSLWPLIFLPRSLWSHFTVLLCIGVAGLIAFSRRYELPIKPTQENLHIPGDGTNYLLNKTAGVLISAAGFATYAWWIGWLAARNMPHHENSWYHIGSAVLVMFVVVAFHELGHTAVGLALRMKLRALMVGPLQWRIRDGRWQFQFEPAEILLSCGGTAVVPAVADFPRWREICVSAAGPVANLLTGVLALWTSLTTKSGSPLQAGGATALFGAWSVLIGVANLLPFRTGEQYSDGAAIYQLLSHGPWGDLHRVNAVVASSLVTKLRPKDYDIETILRTARFITQGKRGLLLRFYAYSYYFDQERFADAGQALKEAESIYDRCASEIPAPFLLEFVFGNAYVCRDAAAARKWWARMEGRKPAHLGVDYWMAASALHWIESNIKEAYQAWEKCNAIAQRLPAAGAYQFDRYRCGKLREALDEVGVAG